MDLLDDLDDLDYIQEIEGTHRPRKKRVYRNRRDHFNFWDDTEFHNRFRLTKSSVKHLLSLIEHKLKKSERKYAISPMEQLLVTLRFFACGSFYITIGDFAGLHKSTVCRLVQKITDVICDLSKDFIYLPKNAMEITEAQTGFMRTAKFPRVISAIDCTHVKIISPGGEAPEIYRNRKGYFSINVQVMCSYDMRIQNVVARWPGSTHDSHIFGNSFAKARLERGDFLNGIVLGDSGYALNRYLLTPLTAPSTNGERLYNESHVRTRNVIERCFGILKRRFPVLSLGLRCNINLARKVIVAVAILHNIAIQNKEIEPAVDDNLELAMDDDTNEETALPNNTHNNMTRNIIIDYFNNLI